MRYALVAADLAVINVIIWAGAEYPLPAGAQLVGPLEPDVRVAPDWTFDPVAGSFIEPPSEPTD